MNPLKYSTLSLLASIMGATYSKGLGFTPITKASNRELPQALQDELILKAAIRRDRRDLKLCHDAASRDAGYYYSPINRFSYIAP